MLAHVFARIVDEVRWKKVDLRCGEVWLIGGVEENNRIIVR